MDEGYLFQEYLETYRKDLFSILVEGGAEGLLLSFEMWLIEQGHVPEPGKRKGTP